ncbi:MAG: shikimate dehydrogenase [Burkholderiaceae bacterium]
MTPTAPPARYAVIGNPVSHSRSPAIHRLFAGQFAISLTYDTLPAPLDGFADTVHTFFSHGGAGLNVTVPFKEQAYALARSHAGERAHLAGAANTLWMQDGFLHADNTDGAGLTNDLKRLGFDPRDKRILLVGAGGAARGVLFPLLAGQCRELTVVNRTAQRAHDLRRHCLDLLPNARQVLNAGALADAQGHYDIVINATSSSLGDTPPALPTGLYNAQSLAYDMVYAAGDTPFMAQAREQGAGHVADGLGMLVGQAAESFRIWHGVAPDTAPVLTALREALAAPQA